MVRTTCSSVSRGCQPIRDLIYFNPIFYNYYYYYYLSRKFHLLFIISKMHKLSDLGLFFLFKIGDHMINYFIYDF